MNRREEVVPAYDALPQDAFKDREPSASDLVARAIALTEVCDNPAAALDDFFGTSNPRCLHGGDTDGYAGSGRSAVDGPTAPTVVARRPAPRRRGTASRPRPTTQTHTHDTSGACPYASPGTFTTNPALESTMTFWQVFAQRHEHTRDIHGEAVTSHGISLSAHCHPYDTFEQAADGILAWEHLGSFAYVVEAATSLEANRLAWQVFFEAVHVPEVHLIGQIRHVKEQ